MMRKRVYTEEDFASWPDCSVPDCHRKVYCGGGSDKCYPHTFNLTPEEIKQRNRMTDEELEKHHAMLVERKRLAESN